MINRDRAWRRKKSRVILSKLQDTTNWVVQQFKDPKKKPLPETKQHKHGKLTHVQQMRQNWALNQELREGF